MENNILTAEEFLKNKYVPGIPFHNALKTAKECENMMIEFARLHCEEQKSQICHQMDLQLENSQEAQKIVNNTYHLTKIK